MRIHGWWTRYWFGAGGRVAAAVVRIAIAIAVMLVLARIAEAPPVSRPETMGPGVYHPIGILLLFRSPPPPLVIAIASVVAWSGAVAMLLGLFTRIATAVTALGAITLASQAMSYQPSWSHDVPVVLLALVAFLGARGGDAVAIDAWLRRRRGEAPPAQACYQWSLRLVQFAVGLMFVSACVIKLRSGGLAWAFSDNLRHQLLARYDLVGEPHHPAIVDWLLAEPWHYECAAALNLISQAMPLFAIVFAHRPLVRALAAACFLGEVAALYAVMQLGNPSWFPLAAVFIDWDALFRIPAPSTTPRASRGSRLFVIGFVAYDLLISFWPGGLDQELRTFPFSRFPMFATMRVKRPYDVHQSYELTGGRMILVSDRAAEPWIQAEIERDYVFRSMHHDVHALEARLRSAVDELARRYPALGVRGVRLVLTVYRAPAYPATAHLDANDIGIIAEVVDGRWTSHYVPHASRVIDPALPDGTPLRVYRDGEVATPIAVMATSIALPHGMVQAVADLVDADGVVRPFVVATP